MYVVFIRKQRRTSSTTSSIFDLSSEADRLDQCIRDNDVIGVRKIASVHINKFNLTLAARIRSLGTGPRAGGGVWATDAWSSSGGDSISNRTRSHSYSTASGCFQAGSSYSLAPFNDVFSPGRKLSHSNPLQTLPSGPGHDSAAPSRRESNCTCTSAVEVAVVPWIFKNALHAAVQTNAVDVLAMLLDIGVDPNRTGTGSSTDTTVMSAAGHDGGLLSPARSVTSSRGAGRDVRFCLQTSEEDADDSFSRDDVQRLTSVSSSSSTRSRPPPRSPSTEVEWSLSTEAGATLSADVARHSIKSRSRPSVRSRTGNGGHNSAAHRGSSVSGSTFDGAGLYTVEYLYGLPPLFLAAVQRNVAAVKLLLVHGAVPDFVDAVGRTPLHLSASSEFLSWQCAAAMVESGARIRFRSATDRLTAAELCPELVGRQTAILRDSLAGVDAFCRRHRETVAKRAEQQARAAAAATRVATLHADHFRFDAGRFFRWSHKHEPTDARRRRLDSGRRTTTNDSVVVDPESESTVWIDYHDERSDSITSLQSGRISFSVRPSVSSRPSQLDDADVDMSQFAADGEKVG